MDCRLLTPDSFWGDRKLKRKKAGIAPLRPPTLAPFLAWGSSAGAGRTRSTKV